MINMKEITTSVNKVYKTAFDEGYKRGYDKAQEENSQILPASSNNSS